MMTKKVYTMFLIKVARDGKDLLNWAENLRHKRIGKSLSLTWRVCSCVALLLSTNVWPCSCPPTSLCSCPPVPVFCPTGRVAPIGSIWVDTAPRRNWNPAHSGRPAQQDVWHLIAVSSFKSRMTTPRRENRATVATLPEWNEVSSEVTCEWKLTVHLRARSWELVDLRVKVNSTFASTCLRVT